MVVPVIGLSDQTQLTNYSWDNKAWPVYLTIGNILSRTQNSPPKRPILLLALKPVAPKVSHESICADEVQRQMNADALQAVFDLILAPLQGIANDGTVIDCTDGKRHLCFPILSAGITDHAKHSILNGISSKSCLQCEVQATEFGQDMRNIYEPCSYAHYAQKTWEYEQTQDTHIADCFHEIGMKIDHSVFSRLYRVNPADLHKPDLLHNISLRVVKYMVKWIEGFRKKHKRQQAFDDIWKVLPPYLSLNVPVTTLYIGSYKGYTTAHMAYLEVASVGTV